MVSVILRFEGLAFLLLSLYFYNQLGGNWLLFFVLLFLPDISMIGYLRDKKIGAALYNLVHNYILATIVIGVGVLMTNNTLILLGLILFAHVGLDRLLGFGLKYPENFKHTHLQKV